MRWVRPRYGPAICYLTCKLCGKNHIRSEHVWTQYDPDTCATCDTGRKSVEKITATPNGD